MKINYILIAKDGLPFKKIAGKPITNFLRRLFSHKECEDCYHTLPKRV
jgi:hypothetical protein